MYCVPNTIFKINIMLSLFDTNEAMVSRDWINVIGAECFQQIYEEIQKLRQRGILYPPSGYEFNMYNIMPPEEINVFILGQSPYPDINANGIAFSCRYNISESIRQLYHGVTNNRELLSCSPDDFPYDITLQHWIDQGVFLTNVTHVASRDESLVIPSALLQKLVRNVIKTIDCPEMVFILLGSDAKLFAKNIQHGKVLVDSHPILASRQNLAWTTTVFNDVNSHLSSYNKKEIQWV